MSVQSGKVIIRSLLLICLLLAGHLSLAAQQEQKPEQTQQREEGTLSLETTQVVLNVTVTDALENYVTGLRERDFRVFEDKVQQKIINFSFAETPFAAVILVDTSGSMEQKMSLARSACSTFVSGIRTGDNVAIYGFGDSKVKKLQDFSEVRDVEPMLWDTNAKGMTPLYDAIVTAVEALAARPERRRAILIVSDGADTRSKHSYDDALKGALAGQITIYSVNMTDAALLGRGAPRDDGSQVLKSLAEKTGGRFYPTPGGLKLRDAFEQTVDELRNQYTIVYEPTNDKQDGRWRAIAVTTRATDHTIRTRQGYYARKARK